MAAKYGKAAETFFLFFALSFLLFAFLFPTCQLFPHSSSMSSTTCLKLKKEKSSMRPARQMFRWRQIWLLGFVFYVGCGFNSLITPHPPRLIQVAVNYLPHLVKGSRPQFPPAQVLVLLPVDKRNPYPAKNGALPAWQDNTAILGIWGINANEGVVRVNSGRLGAQRRMKAGISQNPDVPSAIFTHTNLPRTVQDALESHFREAGFPVRKASFSSLSEADTARENVHYALGCAIEQFSLVSLERYHEVVVDTLIQSHTIDVPIRGPTRAEVTLTLTLYRWPSGEVLWEGKVADAVDDPPLQEHEFLYASPGEVLSMALSRAVGSILITQSLQDVLLASPPRRSPG
jgi:hypothetical protein